jgi:hypothetical protein
MTGFRPRHLSVSSVELYARCAAQWKRRYVNGVIDPPNRAMAWGSAFHSALEAGHNGDDAAVAWLHAWNVGRDKLALQGLSFGPGKPHGLELLDEYAERGLDVECPAEVKFVLPFPSGNIPVPLLGYVDAFAPNDTREYKTSAGGWWSQLRADMSHQAQVYSWVRQRMLNHRKPVRIVVFGTRAVTIDEYIVETSPDGMRLFERLAEGVWDGIVNERFDGCGDCFVCKPGSKKRASNEASFDWGEAAS